LKIEAGKYFDIAQAVIDKLYDIPRTGWVDRGVKNPETVGEHTDELIVLAERHFHVLKLGLMLKIHDWPESDPTVGDRRTDPLCPPKKRWTKEQKYQAEREAMLTICANLGPHGPMIFSLWMEFAEQQTPRARRAYQLDKFQLIMKAIQYQKEGQPVNAQEFIDYDGPAITDPFLRKKLLRAQAEL